MNRETQLEDYVKCWCDGLLKGSDRVGRKNY